MFDFVRVQKLLKSLYCCILVGVLLISLGNKCFAKKEHVLYPVLYFQQGIRLHKQGALKEAVVALNNALTLNPNDLPTLIELGKVFIDLSRHDLAIPILQQAVKLVPDDALIHLLLAEAFWGNKKYNESINEYKLAIKLEPENVLLKANLGQICSLTSDHKCAIENLNKVIPVYPSYVRGRAALGLANHLNKNYNSAQEHYSFVLGYEPSNSNLLYNLAKTNLALGDYAAAKLNITEAINLKSSIAELFLDRAFINYKLNLLEEAQNDYLKALELEPLNPTIPSEFGLFLWKTGAYLKAGEQFTKAISLEPDNKDFKINKAYFLQLANQKDNAVLAWEDVIKEDDKNELALFNLAVLYEESQNYEKAKEYYKKLLEVEEQLHKEDIEVKLRLAFCLQQTKDYDSSKTIYENVLTETPNDSQVLYNLGVLLTEQEKYKEATPYLEKTLENSYVPASNVYKILVKCYTELNDESNLSKLYKDWLEVDKSNTEARISYAKFLAKTGDSHEAVNQYRVAVALDDDPKNKFKLAQFLFEQKDVYGAIGQLQEYLKTFTQDLSALILLANVYKDLGIHEEAINTYKKIIAVQVDNHLAYYNLGLLYASSNKHNEAQNSLLKAIELNEKYSPAYYALALSYMTGNNHEKAKELFKKYIEIDPDGEYKDKAEAKLKELLVKTEIKKA